MTSNRTTCRDAETRKLVRYQIVFLKRGLEAVLPPPGPPAGPAQGGPDGEPEEMVAGSTTQEQFRTMKIADLMQNLARVHRPPEWVARRYPPGVEGPYIDHLPPGDTKYLAVYSRVLDTFVLPDVDWCEQQVGALRDIAGSLDGESRHRVKLPASRVLAGPLDDTESEFGDEFLNFPDYLGETPAAGHTMLTGSVQVFFEEPRGDLAPFDLFWFGVGTPVRIEWGGGQVFLFERTRTYPLPFLPDFTPVRSRGVLNLATGEVDPASVEIHAVFQGTTIARTDRVNRIPYAFPYIYPPLPPPEGLIPPPGYVPPIPPPRVFGRIELETDAGGEITGLRLASETWAPVGLFPAMAAQGFLFPRFSFGPDDQFHFANPDLCLGGTPPAHCPNDQRDPDGLLTSVSVYFHPHIDLVTREMSAVTPSPSSLACLPEAVTGAAVVAAGGRIYRIGGFAGAGDDPTASVGIYDPAVGAWIDGPELPTPVAHAAAVVMGDGDGWEIHVLGGWSGKGRKLTDAVQVLGRGGGWREGPALPEPVAESVAAVVGGTVWLISGRVVAGRGKWKVSDRSWKLARGAGVWEEGPEPSLPVAQACAVASEGSIYVLGGRDDRDEPTRRSSVLDTASGRWGLGPELEAPVYGGASARIGSKVYLVGGRRVDGGAGESAVQEIDLEREAARGGVPALVPVADAGAATVGGVLYVVGGTIAAGEEERATDILQSFHPALGWSVCDGAPAITAASVMNAAGVGLAPVPLAPGSLALVVGPNLGLDRSAVTVTVGGDPAPVLSLVPLLTTIPLGGQRLVFQVPDGLDVSGGAAQVRIETASGATSVPVPVADAAPGIFQYAFQEMFEPAYLDTLSALVTNVDGDAESLNFADQPAAPGEKVVLWVTGLGTDLDAAAKGADVRLGATRRKASVDAVQPSPLPGVQRVVVTVPKNFEAFSSNVPVTIALDGKTSNRASLSIRAEAKRTDPPTPPELGIGHVFGPPGLALVEPPGSTSGEA